MRFLYSSRKIIWILISIFLIFSVAIGIVGYFFFQIQKRQLVQEKRQHLGSIADLKVSQIDNWRKERLAEATIVLENPFIGDHIQEWLESPWKIGLKKMIYDWITARGRHLQYEKVVLLDLKGTVRLSFPEGGDELGPDAKRLVSEAIQEKRVILSDLYRGKISGTIRLSLVVPILIRKGQDVFPVGVLLLRIDPNRFLYPLIQSWPTPSETGETILVRRQGEEVEFLNELRHGKDAVLTLRLPLTNRQVPAVMAVLGKEGIKEGMDYRGVPVVAAMRRIPDSPWFIVAKVDQEEIYAPIRRSMWEIGFVTSLLVIGIGLSVGLASHQQRAQFYKRLYRAEQERQALAKHFEYLTKYANDIVLLMDENLNIIEVNNRAIEIYGYSREELLQRNLKDLWSSGAREILDEQKREIDERGATLYESLHQRKDGTDFLAESSSRVIEIEGKRFYQSIICDITERKQAEEALREKTRLNQTLLDAFPCTALLLRPQTREIIASNASAVKVGAVPSTRCFSTWGKRQDPCPWCLAPTLWATGEAQHLEVEALGIFWDAYWIPIAKDIYMHFAFDITERKRLEEEALEMERQLQHCQRIESLGVLAGGIAHDFNNILLALMGNLELAQVNLESSSKLRRYIGAALKASSRAAEITRQMLVYSGRGVFVVKPTDLSAVVDGMSDLLRSSISRAVSLQFDLCRALPSVTLDSGQMEQIIMNMVINASEAIGERSGLVIVRTGVEVCDESYLERSRVGEKPPPGRFVFFEVCDTGCGMDEKTQRRFFDPFFTTKFTGRGLGMSAVLGIVRGHKGAIVVESEVGRGTKIRVLFPVHEVEGEKERPREEAVSNPSGENVSVGFSGTVLVVDDEEAVCDLCKEKLEGFGFTVLTAGDGEEGVRVFREHAGEITCVILDFMMPKMDGVAAFGEISRIRPDVRVILSSGYDYQEATRRFAGQGLSGFIQKPYTLQSLRRELERVLA